MRPLDQVGQPQLAAAVVLDSTGQVIAPDHWARVYAYNGDGTLNYEEATDGVSTWRRTCGYTNGKITSLTAWVKQ